LQTLSISSFKQTRVGGRPLTRTSFCQRKLKQLEEIQKAHRAADCVVVITTKEQQYH